MVEVIFHALARGGEEFSQDIGHGEERRARAPGKAVLAELLRLASWLSVLLPNFNGMTGAGQTDRRGPSSQTGADDEDLFQGLLPRQNCDKPL